MFNVVLVLTRLWKICVWTNLSMARCRAFLVSTICHLIRNKLKIRRAVPFASHPPSLRAVLFSTHPPSATPSCLHTGYSRFVLFRGHAAVKGILTRKKTIWYKRIWLISQFDVTWGRFSNSSAKNCRVIRKDVLPITLVNVWAPGWGLASCSIFGMEALFRHIWAVWRYIIFDGSEHNLYESISLWQHVLNRLQHIIMLICGRGIDK